MFVRNSTSILTVAINGGEDYELLFTIAMEDFDKIKGNPNFYHWSHDAGK
jgi:thiamine monophosphate kinase